MNKNVEAIEKCPICNNEVMMVSYQPHDGYQGESTIHYVCCKTCRVRSFGDSNKQHEIERWNGLPQPPTKGD